ncbi:MAG: CPBP family intramembrane metalloprotease [Streptococcaceae bacterium]|jgi:membrane protease YdiL (CAAX protease family)|nr:CPBP family intramembrane metalloprotease [Streptococcaceae bacterium]
MEKVKDIFQVFCLFCLDIIPVSTLSYFIKQNKLTNQTFSVFQLFVSLVVLVLTSSLFIIWRKRKFNEFWTIRNLKGNASIIFNGYLAIIFTRAFSQLIMWLGHVEISDNQAWLKVFQQQMPFGLAILSIALVGPLMEESIFRLGMIGLIFKEKKWIGLLISSIIFGFLHSPNNIFSFFPYFFMGIVFGVVYIKTQKIEVSMTLHALWNFIGIVLVYLQK